MRKRRHHNVYPITHSIVNDIVSDLTSGDIGTSPTDDTATGSASVVVSASGVGASTAASGGLASVTISAVAEGEDASGSTAAGSAAIVISASGVGASTAATDGAASITVGTSGVGASTAATDGAASIAVTATGVGQDAAATGRSEGVTVGYASGTTADYYVASDGSDSNNGSIGAPFATVRKAAEELDGTGGTIAVRGGTYRQSESLSGLSFSSGLTIHRYDDEVPWFSGAEVLTGLTACDASDATLLGSAWENCYKADIPAGDLSGSIPPAALNLHEAGEPLGLATDKATVEDDIFTEDMHNFHLADNFNDSGGAITEIQDASVFGSYTAAQLTNATAAVYVSGNWVERQSITNYNGSSTITISGTGAARYASSSMWLYALENMAANIQPGQWAYKATLNGNGSRTVYVYPNNPANVTGGIEFSKRTYGIDTSDASKVTIDGVYARQQAGTNNLTCVGVGKLSNPTTPTTDITLKEVMVRGLSCNVLGYGAFHFNSVTGLKLENCSAENLRNTNGYLINGCEDVEITDCDLYRCSTTPIRVYASEKVAIAYTAFRYGGRAGHSNKIEIYLGNDKVLLYGVRWDDYMGYATHQQSSNIFVGMCEIPGDRRPAYGVLSAGNYAYKDQNYGSEPDTNGVLDIWNNFMPPNPANLNASGGTLYLGESGSNLDIYDVNNITGGGGDINSGMSKTVLRKNNLLTHAASFQNTDASDLLDTNLANTYVDAENGDFTPKPGGNIYTKEGYNYASGVSARAAAAFPGFDFSLDFNKSALNWVEPSVGHITRNPAAPDETAPTLTSPVDTASGATGANGSVSTNEGNGTLYWVVTQSSTSPSAAQVKAGQDHTSSAADDSGSQSVTTTGTQNLSPAPSGLSPSTGYYIHFMHEDAATNQSAVVSGDGFTTDAVDVTAPTLSSPSAAADGATAATASVSTNEGNGTLYWVVTQSSTSPSAAQVKAGNDHTSTAADDSGSQAVSGTGTQNLSPAPSGLTAETTYYVHFMHEDAATNQSSVSTSGSFTTEAESSYTETMVAYDGDPILSRSTALSGVSDGGVGTFYLHIKPGSDPWTDILDISRAANGHIGLWQHENGLIALDITDTSGGLVSNSNTNSVNYFNTELFLALTLDTAGYRVNINGTNVISGAQANKTYPFTAETWNLFALTCEVGRFAFWPGVAMDFTDTAVSDLFYQSGVAQDPALSWAQFGEPAFDLYGATQSEQATDKTSNGNNFTLV